MNLMILIRAAAALMILTLAAPFMWLVRGAVFIAERIEPSADEWSELREDVHSYAEDNKKE